MGQRSSRCKEADLKKDFGRVHFHHGTPPQSFTCLVEAHPHLVGVGEENVGGKKKKTRKEDTCKKKKRFRLWRWMSCWRAGQKCSRKSSSAQSKEEAQGIEAPPERIPDVQSFLQQVTCSVDNHNHQESSTSDPEILPAAEEHLAVHPEADVLQSLVCSDNVTQAPVVTASDWSIDVPQTPARTASDWSIDVPQTPARTASDWSIDVPQTPARTASDWSIDVPQTPARTASDWSIDVTQTPALTVLDWCADIAQTPVRGTPSDWSIDVTQSLVHTTFDWNANVTQTPVCTASDWSIDVLQKPVSLTEVSVSTLTRQLENNKNKTVVINSRHYVINNMLGEGTFGVVYDGSRLLDCLKVAVKVVRKTEDVEYISIPYHSMPLPVEVALLILANRGPSVPEIIQLLDWKDQHDYYIMVLEHPSPCEDLFAFTERHGGSINEGLARVVLQQATQAANMCCRRGVLHRDIKLENLLINKETHEVKLIDFGCGDLLKKSAYKIFTGTDQYCPPEYEEKGEYNGKPATVWSLGVLLFTLVSGDYPNTDDLLMINANNYSKAGLSEECCHLIRSCLQREPQQRLRLSEMLLHDWFKVTDVENLKTV